MDSHTLTGIGVEPMTKPFKTEQYMTGHYDVRTVPPYPIRIGHITGAKHVYLAEHGRVSLGYFKTIQAAAKAIYTAHSE